MLPQGGTLKDLKKRSQNPSFFWPPDLAELSSRPGKTSIFTCWPYPQKSSKMTSQNHSFGVPLGTKTCQNAENEGTQKYIKKWTPPSFKQNPIYKAGGSWAAPLVHAFSEQETTVWAGNNSSCSFLSLFLSPDLFWRNLGEKTESLQKLLLLLVLFAFPFQRLMIWHALGKARRFLTKKCCFWHPDSVFW